MVTDTNETILVLNHLLDAEAFTWVIRKKFLYIALHVALQDLALVSTDQKFAIEPNVSCVVLRYVTVLFFVDDFRLQRQILILLDEVFVGLLARNK